MEDLLDALEDLELPSLEFTAEQQVRFLVNRDGRIHYWTHFCEVQFINII
jgi:hypothetical protein